MVCIGLSSGVKDGKRNYLRIGLAALRTPRISVLKLFDANSGIYALNALHVLRDPQWIEKLTKSMTRVESMGLARSPVDREAHQIDDARRVDGPRAACWESVPGHRCCGRARVPRDEASDRKSAPRVVM
jgi:hypothetical protein